MSDEPVRDAWQKSMQGYSSLLDRILLELRTSPVHLSSSINIQQALAEAIKPMQGVAEQTRMLNEWLRPMNERFKISTSIDQEMAPSFHVRVALNPPAVLRIGPEYFEQRWKKLVEKELGNRTENRLIDVGVFHEEPTAAGIITVGGITDDLLQHLAGNPQELLRLSPDRFEELIMNRLSKMGYEVFRAGKVNQPDGGVDIIFKSTTGLPHIGVVQAKHHSRPDLNTGIEVVQRLDGVLNRHRHYFNMGMVVTNTSFTTEAEWYAKPLELYLRLRGEKDLHRWIKGEFNTPEEERELPTAIQLTSKLTIPIKKQ